MLTEPPEIQADIPGHPNIPVRQDTPAIETIGQTTLLAATNALVTIVTFIAVVEGATLDNSRSIMKANIGMTPVGVATHTRITTAHHLAAHTNTKTVIGRLRGLPTSGSAAEMPCPHVPSATDRMTATGEANLTTTTMAIRISVRGTAASLHEVDTTEANEIGVASTEIKN
jgi:hypothetical protein